MPAFTCCLYYASKVLIFIYSNGNPKFMNQIPSPFDDIHCALMPTSLFYYINGHCFKFATSKCMIYEHQCSVVGMVAYLLSIATCSAFLASSANFCISWSLRFSSLSNFSLLNLSDRSARSWAICSLI